MLELVNVSKTYVTPHDRVQPLRNVSLSVRPGEFVAVHGPSGCGKSTLLLTAAGLLHPESGSVLFDGQDLYRLSADARNWLRARTMGFVFQQFHLIPYLHVLDNVLAPTLAAPLPGAAQTARQLLDELGLTPRLRHMPAELSTGERQRVALARALLHQPKIVFADEPTGNLDAANGAIVLEHLRAFAARGGAVLLVTHDAHAAESAQRRFPMSLAG